MFDDDTCGVWSMKKRNFIRGIRCRVFHELFISRFSVTNNRFAILINGVLLVGKKILFRATSNCNFIDSN